MDRRELCLGAGSVLAALPALASAAALPLPTPSAVTALKITSLIDLEEQAQKVLGEGPFTFAAHGSGAEWTLRENRRAFERYEIIPDYLAGRNPPDLRTTILGSALSLPVFTAPIGAQGLIHASADVGMAQGTTASGTLMTMSGAATRSIEDVAAAATGPKWFKIYLPQDRGIARSFLQRAHAAGFTAIVFTIDALGSGNSEALARTGFDVGKAMAEASAKSGAAPGPSAPTKRGLGWDDVAFIQKESGLPVVLKGVLTPDLAKRAIEHGVAAIQVSNHGGRQTDGLPAALEVLPGIVEAVGGKVPVLMDSGIRRGVDVFKALALGANAVAVGRPALWGLALGGHLGVQSVYDRLKQELTSAMQAAGVDRVDQINAKYVRKIA
jgi:lactate oxidase